jgi:hypothetical protein
MASEAREVRDAIMVQPTTAQLDAAAPTAIRNGGRGGAMLRCLQNRDQTFDCKAVYEWPANQGVGAAAVKMSRLYRTYPAVKLTLPYYITVEFRPGLIYTTPRWALPLSQLSASVVRPTSLQPSQKARVWVTCIVDDKAAAKDCWLANETPKNSGLGEAGVTLARSFKFVPAAINGKPVTGLAFIPIDFGPGGAVSSSDGETDLQSPVWTSAPTAAQVASVWPRQFTMFSADVAMHCQMDQNGGLKKCKPDAGQGALESKAALRLAPFFKAAPPPQSRDLPQVALRIHLVKPGLTMGPLRHATLTAMPSVTELRQALSSRGVADANPTANLDCLVGADGVLQDCRTTSESTPGVGAAFAGLSARMRANLWTEDGLPTPGARLATVVSLQ